MNQRVSAQDLAFAADWLRCYEAAPGDEADDERAERVAAWIDAEIARREAAAYDRLRAKVRNSGAKRGMRA